MTGRKPGGPKTGGRDFAPGNPGGPGRPPLPPALKEAKRLTKTSLEEIVNKYLWLSLEDLEKSKDDKTLVTVEAGMCAIIHKGRTTGEWSGFEWIAQRLIGKVKDQIDIRQVTPFVIKHTTGQQTVLGAKVSSDDEGAE